MLKRVLYSVYFTPDDIGRGLTMDDCRKADTLNAGMLEQVLDDLISWHNIPKRDLNRVMDYIQLEYGHILIGVETEILAGGYARGVSSCGVQL